jgi:hypothetical protein
MPFPRVPVLPWWTVATAQGSLHETSPGADGVRRLTEELLLASVSLHRVSVTEDHVYTSSRIEELQVAVGAAAADSVLVVGAPQNYIVAAGQVLAALGGTAVPRGCQLFIFAKEHYEEYLSHYPWLWSRSFGRGRGLLVVRPVMEELLREAYWPVAPRPPEQIEEFRALVKIVVGDGARVCIVGKAGSGRTTGLCQVLAQTGRMVLWLRAHATVADVDLARSLVRAGAGAPFVVAIDDAHLMMDEVWHAVLLLRDEFVGLPIVLTVVAREEDRVARLEPGAQVVRADWLDEPFVAGLYERILGWREFVMVYDLLDFLLPMRATHEEYVVRDVVAGFEALHAEGVMRREHRDRLFARAFGPTSQGLPVVEGLDAVTGEASGGRLADWPGYREWADYVGGEAAVRDFVVARKALVAVDGFVASEVDAFVRLVAGLVWCGLRVVPLRWVRACYGALLREFSRDPGLFDRVLSAFVTRGLVRVDAGFVGMQHEGFREVAREELFVKGVRPSAFLDSFLHVVFDDGVLDDRDGRATLLLLLSLRHGAEGFLMTARTLLVGRLCASVGLPREVRYRDLRLLFWLCLPDRGDVFARSAVEVVQGREDVVGVLCDAVAQFDDLAVEQSVAADVGRSVCEELEAMGCRVDHGVVHECCSGLYERVSRASFDALWSSFGMVMSAGDCGVGGRSWVGVARALVDRGAVARARVVLGFVDASLLDAVVAREFAEVQSLVGGDGVGS